MPRAEGNPVLREFRQILELGQETQGVDLGPSMASTMPTLSPGGYKPSAPGILKPGTYPDTQVRKPMNPHLTDEQVPQGAWFDKANGLPENTFFAHFDHDGEPREYRQQLHDEVKNEFLDGAKSASPDQTPVAFVFLGSAGSGKGLLFNNMPEDKFVFISPDVTSTHLPEYKEGLRHRARNTAKMVADESVWLTKKILREAMGDRKNLAVDGCGRHALGYLKLAKQLADKGYHTRPVLLYTSLDKALERIKKRGEQTGRWGSEEMARTAMHHIPDTFLRLVPKTPAFEMYDALTFPPGLAWENADGEEKVHNEGFVRKFLETHESWESAMKRIFGPKLFAAYEQMTGNSSPVQAPTFPDRAEAPTLSKGKPTAVDLDEVHQAMIQGAKEDYAKIRKLVSVFKTDQGVLLPDPEWLSEF